LESFSVLGFHTDGSPSSEGRFYLANAMELAASAATPSANFQKLDGLSEVQLQF
jgi:hypothetical protein